MTLTVSDYLKKFCIARLFQHSGGIPADQNRFVPFEAVMVIEHKNFGALGYAPLVNGNLAVVFATILEIEFEGPHGE